MSESLFAARELTCPICNHAFKLHTPKSTVSALVRRDADFCPYYEGPNPLFYSVWVCPACGFAALKDHFRTVEEKEANALRTELAEYSDHRRYDFNKEERTLFAAMLSFQLAVRSYQIRKTPAEIRASLLLRLSWLCRYGNDRKRESQYLTQARALYEEAYGHGLARGARVSEAQVAFLIGEIYRRLGKGQEAVEWFLRAIKGDPEKGDTYRMAREQIYETKESIRFFEYLKDVEILKPLAIEEIAALSVQIKNQNVRAGKVICAQGEAGQSMGILMKGEARVEIDGKRVGELEDGDVFGEISLLTGQPRSATIVADTPVEMLEIDRVSFKTVLQANPAIAGEIARIVDTRQAHNAQVLQGTAPETPEEVGFLARLKLFFELS